MADITQCPSCKRRLQLPDTHVGKPVQCPQCRNTFIAAETDSLPRSPSSLPTPKLDVEPPPPPPPPPPPRRSEFDWSRTDDRSDRPARQVDRRYDQPRDRFSVPHRGGLVVTLGVLSLFICVIGFVLGITAWIMGGNDLREIRAGRMDRSGEGTTLAGMVCGIFGTVIQAILFLIVLMTNVR